MVTKNLVQCHCLCFGLRQCQAASKLGMFCHRNSREIHKTEIRSYCRFFNTFHFWRNVFVLSKKTYFCPLGKDPLCAGCTKRVFVTLLVLDSWCFCPSRSQNKQGKLTLHNKKHCSSPNEANSISWWPFGNSLGCSQALG